MPKKASKKAVKKSAKTSKKTKTSTRKKSKAELEREMFDGLENESDLKIRKGKWVAALGVIIAVGLSLYLVFAPVQHVVFGQLTSQSLKNNSLSIEAIKIYFPDDVAKELSFLYESETTNRALETSVCLRGYRESNTYSIDEVYYPLITYQSYTEVSFKACPDDTLIMLHTHPYKNCEASKTDIRTLRKRQNTNPYTLMLVMCEENRYAIYS